MRKLFCFKIFIIVAFLGSAFSTFLHAGPSEHGETASGGKEMNPQQMEALLDTISADPNLSAFLKNEKAWGNLGAPPTGYWKGMVASFVQTHCSRNESNNAAYNEIAAPVVNPSDDTLLKYKRKLAQAGVNVTNKASEENVLATYVVLFGLGMKESYGNTQQGTQSAKACYTLPAGLFQMSENSEAFIKARALTDINTIYKDQNACIADLFNNHQNPTETRSRGTRACKAFQNRQKKCPGYAAAYSALAIRKTYRHNGPLRTNRVLIKKQVADIFKKAATYADQHICRPKT